MELMEFIDPLLDLPQGVPLAPRPSLLRTAHLLQPRDLYAQLHRSSLGLQTQPKILKSYRSHKALRAILEKYHGRIALCGGLLCRTAIRSRGASADCDLFFYGCEASGRAPEEVQEEYRHILEDCVGMIAASAKGNGR